MEDSRQSPTSYDLHRMHYCWQFKQQCQQAAPNEQWQWTMHCLSCGSFTQSLKTRVQTSSVLSRQQISLCCVHLQTDQDTKLPVWRAFVSVYSPVHLCAEQLLLSFTFWLAGSQVYTLFSFPLHVSILVTAGAPCPNSALSATVCREEKGGEAKEVESTNRLEHFSGVLSFFIWSARSCWTTNQKCAKEKEKTTKHRQELCIPASTRKSPILRQSRQLFLGPLTLFRVSLSLYGLCFGIYKLNSDGNVFNARRWLLCQGLI